eukprot:CAMPEP_0113328026 /NCGR_PEP_ID=MMETSP0010_2-20120614/19733_1 /TAXON_ID=216773 ORGANISM="Corethron hystrix, Strain 308" /NCGR_SAMPLE_ID=MMETSP0010_2 /ASSEMBLY_ACC=CAM_ASM_000155 /LENGTH=144 /DNA_ID=CAMNT_0000189193 /DNA_START=26 /DNA_END=458 /DNA_ORIENTATION=- /assembly_acc=CAM_ASM_000155
MSLLTPWKKQKYWCKTYESKILASACTRCAIRLHTFFFPQVTSSSGLGTNEPDLDGNDDRDNLNNSNYSNDDSDDNSDEDGNDDETVTTAATTKRRLRRRLRNDDCSDDDETATTATITAAGTAAYLHTSIWRYTYRVSHLTDW